jgi:hypothetical protein
MARVRRATGKKSLAIGDRSGLRVPYTSLKTTWDGLRVEPEDWEPKHPQLDPPRNVVDAVALFQPRPDNDPENATFYVGYNYDPFIDPRQRPPVGVPGHGRVGSGYILEYEITVTGVAGTGATGTIDTFATVVDGVAATGALGDYTPESETDPAEVPGVSGTGATGTAVPNIVIDVSVSGTAGTGTLGVFSTGAVVTGVHGLSRTGQESLETEVLPTGVAGTGAFNEAGGITFTAQNGAQLSTAQQKFGTASLLLDGVNDSVVSDQTYNFGSNVFTVDMWVRPTSGTQDEIFYDSRDSTSNNAIALRQAGDNLLVLRGNGTLFNINNVFSANTWVHIAVARGDPFGNTFSVYVNGTKEGSTTFGVTATAADIHIGSDFNGANNWAGYIDELRISDIDRYSGTSFVTPSTAYSADGNTIVLLHFDGANGSTSIVNSTGTSVFEIDTLPSGLAGTGAVHILGESDGSTVRVNVTGIAGIAAVGNVGEEVAVSEVIESGLAGTGAVGTPEPAHGWGDNGWGEEGWGYGL